MLFQCWASVEDTGPTLKQHRVNATPLLGTDNTNTETYVNPMVVKCWHTVCEFDTSFKPAFCAESQMAVSAYFTRERILSLASAEQHRPRTWYWSSVFNPAMFTVAFLTCYQRLPWLLWSMSRKNNNIYFTCVFCWLLQYIVVGIIIFKEDAFCAPLHFIHLELRWDELVLFARECLHIAACLDALWDFIKLFVWNKPCLLLRVGSTPEAWDQC